MDAFNEGLHIPSELRWESDQVPALRHVYDLSWPPSDHPERILTRNYGLRAVVCVPTLDLPVIERSAPVFTALQVGEWGLDTDRVAEIIEAAGASLEPDAPTFFQAGVKFYDVQSMTNTPERFLEDLERVDVSVDPPLVLSGTHHPDPDTKRQLHVTASAFWPLHAGWFYLEGDHLERDRARWQYGILLPDPPIDFGEILPFFEAVTDEPPRYQRQWPSRALYVHGVGDVQLTYTAEVSTELAVGDGADFPALPLHGTNPMYGTDFDRDDLFLAYDLYTQLQATSSFLFEVEGRLEPDRNYRLDQVVAVEPPTLHTLFVAARAVSVAA